MDLNTTLGCKGCLHNVIDMPCSLNMYDSSLCPCQICLIKGMCEDTCEEYNQFRDKVMQFRAEQYTSHIKRIKENINGCY